MLIGILSDSHGEYLAVRAAMKLFDSIGAAHVIHCGDVCGESVFEEMVGRPCTFVWGNCDDPTRELTSYLMTLGLSAPTAVPSVLELSDRRIAVFHGHEREFGRAASLKVDYILHGHTHVRRDESVGGVRIINPGALYRCKERTVATLDLETNELTFHGISE